MSSAVIAGLIAAAVVCASIGLFRLAQHIAANRREHGSMWLR